MNIIKYDPNKEAPEVSIEFFGGMRISYYLLLLSPKGKGEILKEWRGNNWDREKDEFSTQFTGNDLKFAPLLWHFDIFPNPNIPGEKYRINLNIKQEEETVFSQPYEGNVSKPKIITEDGVFVPST